MWNTYEGGTLWLSSTKPTSSIFPDGMAYVGFSAATGGAYNEYDFYSFRFSSGVPG